MISSIERMDLGKFVCMGEHIRARIDIYERPMHEYMAKDYIMHKLVQNYSSTDVREGELEHKDKHYRT